MKRVRTLFKLGPGSKSLIPSREGLLGDSTLSPVVVHLW